MNTFNQAPKFTTWFNPTETEIAFKIYVGLPQLNDDSPAHNQKAMKNRSPWEHVRIAPKTTVQIPSVYDDTVQTVDPVANQVIGGLAPQLVNKTTDNPPKHDPKLSAIDVAIPPRPQAHEQTVQQVSATKK